MTGLVGLAMAVGIAACHFEKKLTLSYTLRIWDDIPAGWDVDYYSWRLHQPVMLPASQLKARLAFRTPKGMGQPPTGFVWTLRHLDGLGAEVASQTIPGAIKVRKYNGKSKLNLQLPAFDFQAGDELVVSGNFNGFVPSDTTVSAKLKLAF